VPPVLIVSGTGTEVGKTVVTAAVAALAARRGHRVTVVKPAQTGEPAGPTGDLAVIRRLSGVTRTHELARFPDPLSPEAAARAARRPPLDLAERANLTDLAVIAGQPLAGAIAAGAARLSRAGFLAAARAGLGPALGGTFRAETT
jgi:dethiobiotin synthetase